ncbi:hypothetical protein B0T24DRAFT_671612 [Lasiosphaeria ovina]|uniref:Zn(2)-C6 fungal-type domain-containing protein n=1 Tax=Lasiosphaeria ovina TaxID=92902 RepID=A0AAE0JSC4_9PEZI|nr:hypothetical protein B0T24DRAFT_671612 [Lasiosphaeria ovina]
MVYRGPSKGCKTCRNRRVKCDEKTPGCGNCARCKRSCPGYDDLFGNRHRDETSSIVRRNGGKTVTYRPAKQRSAVTSRSSLVQKDTRSAAAPLDAAIRSTPAPPAAPLLISILLPDTESAALSFFFFLTYGASTSSELEATCSFFAMIPRVYARCLSSSPLALATTALAVNVTCLWRLRGSDTTTARQCYARAVTAVKKAVADPEESTSDELLMATMVLEAYDRINAHFQRVDKASLGLHTSGSVALLRHRAALNFRDELSQRMVISIRNNIIREAILGWESIGEFHDVWEDGGPMPQSPAIEADKLAFRLHQLRDEMRRADDVARSSGGFLLAKATALADDCSRWLDDLPDHWSRVAVRREDLDESIKAAGTYGASCDVYTNISIAVVRNWHRVIELGVLQILHRLQTARDTSALADNERSGSKTVSRVQAIVDEMCASVPYQFGDMVRPCIPFFGDRVRFPHVEEAPWATALSGRPQTLPESMSRHEHQVASSGGLKVYRALKAVVVLVEDGMGTARAMKLRQGQLDWIKSQISRFRSQLDSGSPS